MICTLIAVVIVEIINLMLGNPIDRFHDHAYAALKRVAGCR